MELYAGGAVGMTITSSGNLDATGVVTANAGVVVDTMTLDAATLTATGDFTVDAVGDIELNADGSTIVLKDASLARFTFNLDSTPSLQVGGTSLEIETTTDNADMLFKGSDGGSAITALTLDMSEAGAATLNNGLTLTDGNLVVASGHGIDFSAVTGGTGTATGNVLDDYEEGTWTPAQGTFTTWTSPTFTATYTKIGRMVQLNLRQTGGTVGASSVALYINGLPFTPAIFSVGAVSQGGVSDLGSCVVSGSSLYFTNSIASENDLIATITYYV
tara:strand:+ start:161 stop:982 length:822 start_codon:yes stop_codon:yes gene_type:complete